MNPLNKWEKELGPEKWAEVVRKVDSGEELTDEESVGYLELLVEAHRKETE